MHVCFKSDVVERWAKTMSKKNVGYKKVICLLLIIFSLCLTACNQKKSFHTGDVTQYLQTEGHIENEGTDIRSGLFIFPDTVVKLENVEYEYYCEEGILDNTYMIYLKAEYPDQESYEAEIERLANICCSVKTSEEIVVNDIEYTEDLFEYPAYVSVYNTNMSFEYALTDVENNIVVYVYLKLCEGAEFLPEEYLPIEFKSKSMMNYDTSWENQNIYYAPDGTDVYVYYLDEM